jgi:hypothetical protein
MKLELSKSLACLHDKQLEQFMPSTDSSTPEIRITGPIKEVWKEIPTTQLSPDQVRLMEEKIEESEQKMLMYNLQGASQD